MGKIQAILDKILEDAFNAAMATLKEEATGIVAATLKGALEARLKALLDGEAPDLGAPERAKAKVAATATLEEVKEEAPKTPRRRSKTKAATLDPEDDLTAILDSVKLALEKYRGIATPRGKELPDVLYRRVKKTLEHAQSLGRADMSALARSALAYIHADPRGTAMASWQALAAKLGLPIPVAQG